MSILLLTFIMLLLAGIYGSLLTISDEIDEIKLLLKYTNNKSSKVYTQPTGNKCDIIVGGTGEIK